jgi:hypothetical protein
MGMIAEAIERLKTGSIKNVVPFAMLEKMPSSPYVVVKYVLHPLGVGLLVIAHYAYGTQMTTIEGVTKTYLEDYIRNEVVTLLDGYSFVNNHGENMVIHDTGEITEITPVSDDNTVSMDRLFYIAQPK